MIATNNKPQEVSIWKNKFIPIRQKYRKESCVLMVIGFVLLVASIIFFSNYNCIFESQKLANATISTIANISTTTLPNFTSNSTLSPLTDMSCCFDKIKLARGSSVFSISFILFCIFMFVSTKSKKVIKRPEMGLDSDNQSPLEILKTLKTFMMGFSYSDLIKFYKLRPNIVILCTMVFTLLVNVITLTWISSSCFISSCHDMGWEMVLGGTICTTLFITILIAVTILYVLGPKKQKTESIKLEELKNLESEYEHEAFQAPQEVSLAVNIDEGDEIDCNEA